MPPSAICLRPDNFTPPSRTPWGGTRLLWRYKAGLGLHNVDPSAPVGESWELSVSEEFPSLTEDGKPLSAVLARDRSAWLGAEARNDGRTTALLVKWIDTDDNLSLQIHPEDDYAGLGAGESGKVEGWYVIAREEGAGIYLGFRPGVDARAVREVLLEDGDLSTLMAFTPVEPGDFYLLDPGTPHAIGANVTLIEPQLVTPGLRGITYRYWDFGRRYDASGARHPDGQPRTLHLEHALSVTRWDRACDPGWLATRRTRLGWPQATEAAKSERLCGSEPLASVASPRLHVARLCGTGALRLPPWNALRSLTVVEGRVVLGEGAHAITVVGGTTAAIPAKSAALHAELHAAHVVVAAALG